MMVQITQQEDVVKVETVDKNTVSVTNQENQDIVVQEDVQQVDVLNDTTQPQYDRIVYAQTVQLFTEEEKMYANRVDFTNNDTVIYRGEAAPGSAETDAVWRIRRITVLSDNDIITEFADGDENFDNIWTDRYNLVYS